MHVSFNNYTAGLIDPSKIAGIKKETGSPIEEQLKHLKSEHTKLQEDPYEKKRQQLRTTLEETNKTIDDIKKSLSDTLERQVQEFLEQKLALFNEKYQTIFTTLDIMKEEAATLEEHIQLLENHQKDPNFKSLTLEPKAIYSYETVQGLLQKVTALESGIKSLETIKHDKTTELKNREKKATALTKELQDKQKAQKEFATNAPEETENNLNFKQQAEILDLELQVLEYQKKLAQARIDLLIRKISLTNSNILLEKERLEILKKNLARARAGLKIAESEIQKKQAELEELRQKSLQSKETHYEEIKRLSSQQEKYKQELDAIRQKHDLEKYSSWVEISAKEEDFPAVCTAGHRQTQIQLIDKKIEFQRVLIQVEDIRFRREEIRLLSLRLWYSISHGKLKSTQEISSSLKKFKDIEAELTREINLFQDKRAASNNNLELENKELANTRTFLQALQEKKEASTKRQLGMYTACLNKVHEAEKNILEQIDTSSKLFEQYAEALSNLNAALKETNIIISQLESKSIWQRSQYAISWQGIKNIIPDLYQFTLDLQQLGSAYFASFSWRQILNNIDNILYAPGKLLLLLIIIVCSLLLIWLVKSKTSIINNLLSQQAMPNTLYHVATYALICLLSFIQKHFIILYCWLILWVLIELNFIASLFINIVFYLFSIPFLILIASRLIQHMRTCNQQHEYAIFNSTFEKRFSIVASIFLYLTIFIWFFREAFTLAAIHKSELPNILFAIYSIGLRVLIIFSIGKAELLALIGNRPGFWQWLSSFIDRYYYALLASIITLMILSDPYVGGFGNLVSYILWGSIGTIVLIRILYSVHTYIKKYSEVIFFSRENEPRKERFTNAKTFYGIFVITLFLMFIAVAIVIGLYIWKVPVSFEDMYKWIDFRLFSTGEIEQGEHVWFTPRKFFVLISFILGGWLAAYLLNKFVLQRIFDILPVDLGVQNTVSSITRYLIIIIAIYLGFQWAGLGNLLIAISIVIGSISYILKEPVGDFISYFIILVQRPIQIGDFIKVSEEIQGVVRKITPRSVILRKKDSYSIILPNSSILTQPVSNWSYARNFIAFDDILITINYSADPNKVRRLLYKILEENTEVLKAPRPIIRLSDFAENGYLFLVRGFISNINILRRLDIASDVRFSITRVMAEEGIKLAIPTRVIVGQDASTASKNTAAPVEEK